MTATAAVRAERRYRQLLARGAAADLAALTVDLEERDRRDRQRAEAPLKPADDARILDTSDMGIDEVVQTVIAWWKDVGLLIVSVNRLIYIKSLNDFRDFFYS